MTKRDVLSPSRSTARLPASLLALALGCQGAVHAQGEAWQQTEKGHFVRGIAVDGIDGIAVVVAWPWSPASDPAVVRGLAAAEASRRVAAANAVLPPGVWTQSELADDRSLFSVVLGGTATGALDAWLAALAAPLTALPEASRSDALERDLARAALDADDSDWLYPGDRLVGAARRAAFPGTSLGAGLRGDAVALQQVRVASFTRLLGEAPPAPILVAAVGSPEIARDPRRLERSFRAPSTSTPSRAAPVRAPRVDPGVVAEVAVHPRVDAAFAAIALDAVGAGSVDLAAAAATEVLRQRARQRFGEFRGQEVLARTPFVRCDALLGDPIVLLCRRARTPDALAPVSAAEGLQIPHTELLDLIRDCAVRPVSDKEAEAALAVVRAEWAVPPYPDARVSAMRRTQQALLAPARAACLLGVRGLDDSFVDEARSLDANALSRALADLVTRVVWVGGLVPATTPKLPG